MALSGMLISSESTPASLYELIPCLTVLYFIDSEYDTYGKYQKQDQYQKYDLYDFEYFFDHTKFLLSCPDQSRKSLSFLERLGWRSLRRAFASI